jgi:hypothetical protein
VQENLQHCLVPQTTLNDLLSNEVSGNVTPHNNNTIVIRVSGHCLCWPCVTNLTSEHHDQVIFFLWVHWALRRFIRSCTTIGFFTPGI